MQDGRHATKDIQFQKRYGLRNCLKTWSQKVPNVLPQKLPKAWSLILPIVWSQNFPKVMAAKVDKNMA